MKSGTAAARRMVLRRIIAEGKASNQDQLVRLLARRGYHVTQTTVSRDLAALGVEKTPPDSGGSVPRYRLRGGGGGGSRRSRELARMLAEFVEDVEHSANLVVLKTPPGAADPVAAALDRAREEDIVGTIAGDDTVLVITRNAAGGSGVARRLTRLMEG